MTATGVGQTSPIPKIGVRLGDWRVTYSPSSQKIEVVRANRPDLAHLTVDWGTSSGEVDIHLTRGHEQATRGESDKDWEPLVRLSLSDLQKLDRRMKQIVERTIVPQILAVYRKFRPGWLQRRGYVVMFVEEPDVADWFQRAVPKIRRKFEPKIEQIANPANYPPGITEAFYYPSILDDIRDVGEKVPVTAIRARRRRIKAGAAVTLRYTLGPDGTTGWWGIKHTDFRSIRRSMNALLAEIAVSFLGPDYLAKIDRILVGLGVDESERIRIGGVAKAIVAEGSGAWSRRCA